MQTPTNKPSAQRADDAAENAFTSEGGLLTPGGGETPGEAPLYERRWREETLLLSPAYARCTDATAEQQRERLMRHYAIRYDGRRFEFNGYHYDRLGDAAAYASLMRLRPVQADVRGPYRWHEPVQAPTTADTVAMATHAITFEQGVYCFRQYRYERLADAVSYAQRVALNSDGREN